jgi:hypothetical protein
MGLPDLLFCNWDWWEASKINNKGQFTIIAALLVAVVLIAAVITTYSAIRYSPLQEQPQVLSAIDEINLALKQILGFTVGYYGSVLKVTGNTSYAQTLATNYLSSGLSNIGDIRPEWGVAFNVTKLELDTNWFSNASYSQGNVTVKYDLTGLGIYGISYSASSRLDVIISNSNSTSQASLTILKDENEPLVNLGKRNIKFYNYTYSNSTWNLVEPTNLISYPNGTYSIDLPSGVTADSYVLQVEDTRGIIVTASSFNRYASTVVWNGNYSTIADENIVVELLQNGTIRWLGQNLNLTNAMKPIPPISVKAVHVNQTINGVIQEIPFQVEDWASEYRIPLGLTSNTTVFSNRQMIVFQMNSKVSKFTIWWNGSDEAIQTPLAYTPNTCFTGDDPNNDELTNGKINLQIGSFSVTSRVISTQTSSTANFMRINNENSVYGAGAAYVIHHGVVRDIVQQEAEWGTNRPGGGSDNGGAYGCPNLYANIVITLPANTNYYTYQLRLMFIDSAQSRVITDLCPISVTVSPDSPTSPQAMTENGTANGVPTVTNGTNTFYNYTAGGWTAHHWTQLISGSKGAGIMFTDNSNQRLYAFDSIAGSAVGALKVTNSTKTIELLPVARNSASFTYALDVTWLGAVVTFDNTTPIYKMQGTTPTGLWILAEYPPTITVTAET